MSKRDLKRKIKADLEAAETFWNKAKKLGASNAAAYYGGRIDTLKDVLKFMA